MNTRALDAATNDDGIERYSEYDDWAWLYDQTVGPDYCMPQYRFLQRALLPELPPGARLLDLCCGSGQLIRPLLDDGFRVTGLDGSSAMLDCARHNAPGADYVLADARSFTLPERYDGAFSTSASLNHIGSVTELQQVFGRVHAVLAPGARFVFDLNHPDQMARWWRGQPLEGELRSHFAWMITPFYDAAEERGFFRVSMARPRDGRPLGGLRAALAQWLSKPRFIGLRLALIRRIGLIAPGWARQSVDYGVRAHRLADVEAALRVSGFRDIRVETVDGGTAVDENHSAHFICRKDAP
jgi:SAM-dependent methyltransferase